MMEYPGSKERETVLFEPYFEVLRQRWTHISGFLLKAESDEALELARQLPYERVATRYKRAEQYFERFGLRLDKVRQPELRWLQLLGHRTEAFVQAGSSVDPNFAQFRSLEVAAQRYGKGGKLTGHRDLESDPIAVAIISMGDDAYLDILQNDRQTIITTITLQHGDLAILGAPGLGNGVRPMHRLRVPEDAGEKYDRISVTYRGLHQPLTDLRYGNA